MEKETASNHGTWWKHVPGGGITKPTLLAAAEAIGPKDI
jgi:hypothetical protein